MVGRPSARVGYSILPFAQSILYRYNLDLTNHRASFSSDWGDYVSFAKHMREKADADGSDFLLVDTGDRVEGNAIYDSSKPRGKSVMTITNCM